MTEDEIIELWKKANGWDVKDFQNTLDDLTRFAKLIAEKEREWLINLLNTNYRTTPPSIVKEIRARGQT